MAIFAPKARRSARKSASRRMTSDSLFVAPLHTAKERRFAMAVFAPKARRLPSPAHPANIGRAWDTKVSRREFQEFGRISSAERIQYVGGCCGCNAAYIRAMARGLSEAGIS